MRDRVVSVVVGGRWQALRCRRRRRGGVGISRVAAAAATATGRVVVGGVSAGRRLEVLLRAVDVARLEKWRGRDARVLRGPLLLALPKRNESVAGFHSVLRRRRLGRAGLSRQHAAVTHEYMSQL